MSFTNKNVHLKSYLSAPEHRGETLGEMLGTESKIQKVKRAGMGLGRTIPKGDMQIKVLKEKNREKQIGKNIQKKIRK